MRGTYYRLGKNAPSLGMMYRCSLSALSFQAPATTPSMTRPMMAVFCLQFAGWVYQPPAGDQTCLG